MPIATFSKSFKQWQADRDCDWRATFNEPPSTRIQDLCMSRAAWLHEIERATFITASVRAEIVAFLGDDAPRWLKFNAQLRVL